MGTLEFMRVLFVWALNETFRAFLLVSRSITAAHGGVAL